MKKKKLLTLALSLTLATTLLTACGSSSSNYDLAESVSYTTSASTSDYADYDYDYDNGIASSSYASSSSESADEVDDSSSQAENIDSLTLLEEKLVYHCSLEIETLDYETTIASIKDTIKKYDGIIQSEDESDSSYHWYYEDYQKTSGTMTDYIQVRIPSASYEAFISELDGTGRITSKSTSVDNISQKYYDTTSQIEALKIQEQNLLEMLEQCETIEDMITVQDRLSEVQYELNSLQTSKRYMDTDVAYSYVNINVSEVMEYHYTETPVKTNTFVDRLKNTLNNTAAGFLTFLETLLFLIISLSPYIVIIAIICFIFKKKIKTKIAEHKAKKAADKARRELRNNAAIQQAQFQQQQMKQQQQAQQMQMNQNNQDTNRGQN